MPSLSLIVYQLSPCATEIDNKPLYNVTAWHGD